MSAAKAKTRPVRPALITDLPVAVLLLAGWFSVPAGTIGHVAVGLLFVAWVVIHLATRPHVADRLWRARSSRTTRLRIATWLTIASAAVMTISGCIQWAGVSAMIPIHSTSSYLTILAAGWHVWLHRSVLAARLRRPSS